MRRILLFLSLLFGAGTATAAWDPFTTPVIMSAVSTSSAQFQWPGGIGVFTAVGVFNGATVTLQFIGPDGTTLVSAGAATTLTAAGAGVFYLPRCLVQATITSAGGSTSLTASLARVPP